MRLIKSLFVLLASLCTLVEPRPGLADPTDPTSASSPSTASDRPFPELTGLPREFTIVSDVQLSSPVRYNSKQRPVRAAHSWLFLAGTATDLPMRVELVRPVSFGQPRGLALAVNISDAPGSLERLWPQLRRTERKSFTFPRPTYLTNKDLFDPRLPSRHQEAEASLLEEAWIDNAYMSDSPTYVPNFVNSHELLIELVCHPDLGEADEEPRVMLAAAEVLGEGNDWSTGLQAGTRSSGMGLESSKTNDLFWEGPSLSTVPGQAPQRARAWFGLEEEERVDAGMSDFHSFRPVLRGTSWMGVDLSRDPRLTSDVLTADEQAGRWR